MDASQLIRQKMEAANSYVSRNKTVDASFLTMQRMQRASYEGAQRLNMTSYYYRGAPIVNNVVYDISACPIDHPFTNGYTNVNNLAQQESVANTRAGAAICGDVDYSRAPNGIQLKSYAEMSTILTCYNNNTSKPSIPPVLLPVIRFPSIGPLNSLYFGTAAGPSFVQLSQDPRSYTGSTDFTIEFYIRPAATSVTNQCIFYINEDFGSYRTPDSTADSFMDTYRLIGKLIPSVKSNEFNFNVQVSTFPTFTFGNFAVDTWSHVAIERYGTYMNYFQNGNYAGTTVIGLNIPSTNSVGSPPLYNTYLNSSASIGFPYGGPNDHDGLSFYTGYLSNFRWTKGVTLYSKHMFGNFSNPIDYTDRTLFNEYTFAVPEPPFHDNSIVSPWSFEYPYVSVLFLASSSGNRLLNSCSPPATGVNSVSIQDGNSISNITYTQVTWSYI